jgi:hypothetical protein
VYLDRGGFRLFFLFVTLVDSHLIGSGERCQDFFLNVRVRFLFPGSLQRLANSIAANATEGPGGVAADERFRVVQKGFA